MIYFFKLVSGESIIARLVKKTKTEIQILEVQGDEIEEGEGAYIMSPWAPFVEDQTLKLNKFAIITMSPVNEDMAEEYDVRVESYLSDDVELEEAVEEPEPEGRNHCHHPTTIGKTRPSKSRDRRNR